MPSVPLDSQTSAGSPLQIGSREALEPTWVTISYKQCLYLACFPLLTSMKEKGVSKESPPFSEQQVACSSITLLVHMEGLSIKAGIQWSCQVDAVGDYQMLKAHQSPHRARSLGLDLIMPSARSHTLSAAALKWHYSCTESLYNQVALGATLHCSS